MTRTGSRKRGGAYVLALSVSMLVMVIGVAGVASLRAATRSATLTEESIKASHLARSGTDLVLQYLIESPNWRSSRTSGGWYTLGTFSGVTLRAQLVDERDSDLADDSDDPFSINTRGQIGDTVREFGVTIRPDGQLVYGPNEAQNASFESGTFPWAAQGSGAFGGTVPTIGIRSDDPADGTQYLRVSGRSSPAEGVRQTVSGRVLPGRSYDVDLWARVSTGSAPVNVTVVFSTLSSEVGANGTTASVGTDWNRATTSFTTPSVGGVLSAKLIFSTSTGTADLDLDGIVIRESGTDTTVYSYEVVPGTWKRIVQ